MKKIITKSGIKGWQSTIQKIYKSLEELTTYCETYGLLERFKYYSTPEELWNENPTIQGSVNPEDLRVVYIVKIDADINGKRLKRTFTFESCDEWQGFMFNKKEYDIHYCEDYNDVCIYPYEVDRPQLDSIHSQPIVIVSDEVLDNWFNNIATHKQINSITKINLDDYDKFVNIAEEDENKETSREEAKELAFDIWKHIPYSFKYSWYRDYNVDN